MKTITTLLTTLFLAACNTVPAIIPDTTSDNVIMKKLDYDIQHGDKVSTGWGGFSGIYQSLLYSWHGLGESTLKSVQNAENLSQIIQNHK